MKAIEVLEDTQNVYFAFPIMRTVSLNEITAKKRIEETLDEIFYRSVIIQLLHGLPVVEK